MWNVNVVTRYVVQVQNYLEECETCQPVANNSKQTLIEVCHHCKLSNNPVAKDLLSIFTKLNFKVSYKYIFLLCVYIFSNNVFFQVLLEIHDKIALKRLKKTFDTSDLPPTPPSPPRQQNGTNMSTQTYKIIGLRKKPDEPLVSVLCPGHHRYRFILCVLYIEFYFSRTKTIEFKVIIFFVICYRCLANALLF